jgi:NADH-quinone oxidoreductase subunit J
MGTSMEAVIFYVLATVTLVSAFCVVFLRRPMHNVLFMILTMIGLAGFFILLHAEFIAMVQLIVYAGAVMVLFLFVIMLLNIDRTVLPHHPNDLRWSVGIVLAIGVALLLLPVLKAFVPPGPSGAPPLVKLAEVSNTELIARELFTTYLLPFEIASILLLAAIIGAVLLARKRSQTS